MKFYLKPEMTVTGKILVREMSVDGAVRGRVDENMLRDARVKTGYDNFKYVIDALGEDRVHNAVIAAYAEDVKDEHYEVFSKDLITSDDARKAKDKKKKENLKEKKKNEKDS